MTRIRDLLGYATDLTYFKDLGRYKDFKAKPKKSIPMTRGLRKKQPSEG